MKRIILIFVILILVSNGFTQPGKQWWDFTWYDRTIESTGVNSVADADSSCILFAKSVNNWYQKIYNKTGALLYYFDTSGNLGLKASGYLNFDTGTLGNTGYGFWDDSGTLKYKNSGGSWQAIGTTLTQEQVEDYAGGMWAGNTENGITVTYQDVDGTIDIEMDNTAVTPGSYTNTDLTVDADGRITAASNGSAGSATEIQITLNAMSAKLPSSNPAVIDGGENNFRLLFDADTEESVSYGNVLDDDWNSNTLYLDLYWSMASATTDTVVWGVQIWAYTPGSSADINTESYDTANLDTVVVPGTAGYMKKTTIILSNDDSIAAGDLYRIKIYRDADSVSDGATNDAEIYFIIIRN